MLFNCLKSLETSHDITQRGRIFAGGKNYLTTSYLDITCECARGGSVRYVLTQCSDAGCTYLQAYLHVGRYR